MKLAKYIYIFKVSWQDMLEYRLDTVLRFVIALLALVGVFYMWHDIYSQGGITTEYSKAQMTTYYILVAYIFAFIRPYLGVADDIGEGQLSQYLILPASYILRRYWQSLARSLFRFLTGLPILILVFACFQDSLWVVRDWQNYVFLLVTIFGAINILFLIIFLVDCVEFWIFSSSSIKLTTDAITGFFAGALIPLFILPEWAARLADWLPFKYTGFFLVDGFLGKLDWREALTGLAIQWVWIMILMWLVKIVWRRGLVKYEAVGN